MDDKIFVDSAHFENVFSITAKKFDVVKIFEFEDKCKKIIFN